MIEKRRIREESENEKREKERGERKRVGTKRQSEQLKEKNGIKV